MKKQEIKPYDVYFDTILKQIEKDYKLSKDGSEYLLELFNKFLEEFIMISVIMLEHNRQKTLSARDIQSATRALLVGNILIRHAVAEGTKAVTRFVSTTQKKVSKVQNAKLVICPDHIKSSIKNIVPEYKSEVRIGMDADVFLAAVMEYLVVEILELSTHSAKANKRFTINASDIKSAIKNDNELRHTLCRLELKI